MCSRIEDIQLQRPTYSHYEEKMYPCAAEFGMTQLDLEDHKDKTPDSEEDEDDRNEEELHFHAVDCLG